MRNSGANATCSQVLIGRGPRFVDFVLGSNAGKWPLCVPTRHLERPFCPAILQPEEGNLQASADSPLMFVIFVKGSASTHIASRTAQLWFGLFEKASKSSSRSAARRPAILSSHCSPSCHHLNEYTDRSLRMSVPCRGMFQFPGTR